MSKTPIHEPPSQDLSSGSGQTLPSRPIQPITDPLASKRVCFYKSGDYKFSGHRMVINARTFKTFDTLLDALSKKVPLLFGVRTITTPHGTHLVRTLDDLHDGGSYVCSDQRRVKPLNLDEVNRRQVPWNMTRPFVGGRRNRQRPTTKRPAKVIERVAVRTPKKLLVVNNRDPTVKRTIVLQRRTAPTFDALLDYLSQILQFPVLKLFSTDGRRVDGLAALILCAGVVVAAGNEPFRLGNYSFPRTVQMAQAAEMESVGPSMLQPRAKNSKAVLGGRGSRNFSSASERYIVDQVNKSQNGSVNSQLHHHERQFDTEVKHHHASIGTCGPGSVGNEHHTFIVPHEDDIEKSFHVNQDGSMTVEMRVHLTIKEEEILHWTTTLSRSGLTKRTVCASISESRNNSPDSNNAFAKDSTRINQDEMKEENHPAGAEKGIIFNNDQVYEGYISAALGKAKTGFIRTPTPGPRQVSEKASVESVKTVTESGVQESTLEHYSYMERTADGETTEGYRVVRHNSSSNRSIPKPRETASAGASKRGSHSSIRSSGVAEVLQIRNNRMEVTETVMHIYESQGSYNNYVANKEYSTDSVPLHGSIPLPESKLSTVSGPCSSSNGCDIDISTNESSQRQKEEMLSLSSEPIARKHETTNNLSSVDENEAITESNMQKTLRKNKPPKSDENKNMINPSRNQKSSISASRSDKKRKESTVSSSKLSQHPSTDKLGSNAIVGKKSLSSSESAKSGQNSRGPQKPQIKKVSKDRKTPRKEQTLLTNAGNVKRTPSQRQNVNKTTAKDNGHNVNTPTRRPQMKKNILDILQPKKSLLPSKKTINKPKSMTENRTSSSKKSSELSESFLMPSLNPSPSEVHQYVENWLEKVSPDPPPNAVDPITDESKPHTKIVFDIGGDSESDEKKEWQNNNEEHYPSPGDTVKKSASCLYIPLCHTEPATSLVHNAQNVNGVCVSLPSDEVDPVQNKNRLSANKSMGAIDPADNELSSSISNILSPKEKIKAVLWKLCSAMQSIRKESDTNTTSSLEKSNNLPDFPMQVASVFGSSFKAFLSFLSVMTLQDNLTGNQSRSTSEAMIIMESLQRISAFEDPKEQKASLTDLQSSASSQFRECWRDFQILRERLQSEPLSPKVSETEFALDVVSEGGAIFEDQHLVIDELMGEVNMPQDLRAEILSIMQQAKCFYLAEESTVVDTERNTSDAEEDVEKFVEEYVNETQSLELGEQGDEADDADADDDEQTKMMTGSEQTPNMFQETCIDVTEISQLERDKQLKEKEGEGQEEEVEKQRMWVKDKEDGDIKEINDDDGEETEMGEKEMVKETEEKAVTEEKMDDNGKEEWEAEKGSKEDEETFEKVEEGREEEMTVDEEELEVGEKEERQEGLMDKEASEDGGFEETDEQEGVEKTEEEEKQEDGYDEEADDEESGEEGGTEVNEEQEIEEETDEVSDEETHGGEEVDKLIDKKGEREGAQEDADAFTDAEEETEECIEEERITEVTEEEEVENIIEEMEEEEVEEEEKETAAEDEAIEEEEDEGERDEVIEEDDEEDAEERDNEEDKTKVVSGENNEEEEEDNDLDKMEDGEEVGVKNIDKMVITDEDEEDHGSDNNTEEGDRCDVAEESKREEEKTEKQLEEESTEEEEVVEEIEIEEDMTAEQMLDRVGREDEADEINELKEGFQQVEEQETGDAIEKGNVSDHSDCVAGDINCKLFQREASCFQQQSSCEEGANVQTRIAERDPQSPNKCSSEGQCEDDKGDGTDTVNDLETDEGRVHHGESLQHPVEISQELLDFVNSALQSSSLICTYDAKGNVRIETDHAGAVKEKSVPKSREDGSYGLKRLPSPGTSDLSDYRPETSQSGGYDTQDSADVVTDSSEDASVKPSLVCRHETHVTDGTRNVEQVKSERSSENNSESLQNSRFKSEGSSSSLESDTKASMEDLSYSRAVGSQMADRNTEVQRCTSFTLEKDSTDGVLIDKGRWLLKENHLIRKSPPVPLGMYDNVDTTSVDTSQGNSGEDSPSHSKTQNNPLAAVSSSELEEMAKPPTPKCTYYNMPHGSDSDPFLDESSFKSGKKEASVVKGKGFRVSPTIDTSKTWASRNGSLSSFTSVEFKAPDRKVHPEGESSAVTQARRTPSGGEDEVQAQDCLDPLRVRCGQYCPIL